MLSIPRDMFVPIAGTGSSNRINVAFNNSPGQLVATIEQAFGIVINHYAQEDFAGLQGVTNAVGGVCMNFPYPARDGSPSGGGNESGLNIPTAGRNKLNGAMALALVRSRYYQYFVNGAWRAEGTGDIGRIQRQHSFVRALASKAIHASLGNPFTANAVLSKAVRYVKVDTTFTTLGMMRLGLHRRSLHPSGMPSFTLPYRAVSNYAGFGDVLLPEPAQDAAVIAAWNNFGGSTTPPSQPAVTVAPASVTLRVRNGSGVAGQARRAADQLRSIGFSVAASTTASSVRHGPSLVAYGPGLKAAAQTLAAHLGGAVTVQSDAQAGPDVIVTTGTAFTGVTGLAAAGTSTLAASGASTPTSSVAVPPWDPSPC